MTYQDVKNQMLQGSPEGELYQVVSDMIELCEGIGMKPEDCVYFISEQLMKKKPRKEVKEDTRDDYSEFLEGGAMVLWFLNTNKQGYANDGFTDLIKQQYPN